MRSLEWTRGHHCQKIQEEPDVLESFSLVYFVFENNWNMKLYRYENILNHIFLANHISAAIEIFFSYSMLFTFKCRSYSKQKNIPLHLVEVLTPILHPYWWDLMVKDAIDKFQYYLSTPCNQLTGNGPISIIEFVR